MPTATETLELADQAATKAFAGRLARLLTRGDVVTLSGDLGAGKSTLARAAIQALAGAPIEVPSPTFTLVQIYDLSTLTVWHADLYRLNHPSEVDELDLDAAMVDGALLVEWPDRLPHGAFPDRLALHFDIVDATRRCLYLTLGFRWLDRRNSLLDGGN
ncbi:MAG: tRNA (adenosine(37)-N6)-threonylcarbamoyltransferase complex ATPase subunit type 1 TsaE [Pseudomonadota bacterium]